MDILTAI